MSLNYDLYLKLQHKLDLYEFHRKFFDSSKFKLSLTIIGGILFGLGLKNHMKGSVIGMASLIIGLPIATQKFITPVDAEDILENSFKAGFKGFIKGGPVSPSLPYTYYEEGERWEKLCNDRRNEIKNKGFYDVCEREEFLGREVLRQMLREGRE